MALTALLFRKGGQEACKTCAVEAPAFQKAVKRHKLHA